MSAQGFTISGCSVEIFSAEGHPNKMKVSGVLVRLDEPSTKPPNGSSGHRILIPSSVAEKNINSLLNMGINYKEDGLDGHAPTHKVGTITKAWIDGKNLMIEGVCWKKDFPATQKDLKKKNLGWSFEASNISVENTNAPIWKLTDLTFTGATILYRDAAAYHKTSAIAANAARAAEQIKKHSGGISMKHSDKKDKKNRAAKTSKHVSASREKMSVEDALAELVKVSKANTAAISSLAAAQENLQATLLERRVEAAVGSEEASESAESMEASASVSASASESVDADIAAAKKSKKADEDTGTSTETGTDSESYDAAAKDKKDDSASESMSASASESNDGMDDMQEKDRNENDEPGELNKDARTNKGDKTTVSAETHKLAKLVKQALKANADLKAENKKLRKKLEKTSRQVAAAAERQDRHSMVITASKMTQNLLAKEGVDIPGMKASGAKMSVDEVDTILAKGNLSIQQRIAVKSEMVREGLMEEGFVN